MPKLDFPKKSELVDALLKCSCLKSESRRNEIVEELPEFGHNIQRGPDARSDVFNIITTCDDFDGGIERLLEIVEWCEQGSIAWKRAATTAFKTLTSIPPVQVDDLLAIKLEPGDVSREELSQLYRDCHPPDSSLRDYQPHSPFGALLRLFQLSDPQAGLCFATNLVAKLGDRAKQTALLEYVKRAEAALANQFVQSAYGQNISKTFLLIQVKPYDHRNETFILYYWVLKNGRVVDSSPDDTQSAQAKPFDEIIREVEQLAAVVQVAYSKPTVEMIVLRELFHSDVTQWKLSSDESFLRQLKTVFRCHDRFDARQRELAAERRGQSLLQSLKGTKVRLRYWQHKCAELRELGGESIEGHLLSILNPGQYEADDLDEKLQKHGAGLLISLGFAPRTDCGTGWWKALDYGAPLAVWLREIPSGLLLDEQRLKELLLNQTQSAVTLDELPDHIWQMQKLAIKGKDKNDPRYHLTLLYDDYERVPPPP